MPLDDNTPELRNTPQPGQAVTEEKESVLAAHSQAGKDIEDDAELTIDSTPDDDLDEGEMARFESGEKDVPAEQDPLES